MPERAIIRFEQGVKSQATLLNYRDHIKHFKKFASFESYDELVSRPAEELQTLVEDYIIEIKQTRHPNTVPVLMLGVRHFFIMNRVAINWDIIRKMYPPRVKSAGFKPWTTEQIRQLLLATTSKRNRALIHFLASTGARIGVLGDNFKIKYLEDMEDGCKAILLYPDDTEEYWSFLTPEASDVMDEYFDERRAHGEDLTPESPIFGMDYSQIKKKTSSLKRAGATAIMYRLIKRAGLTRTKVNHHFDVQMDHGFRKRFNTIVKLQNDVNSNIAEKLLGHKNGLDGIYLRPTKEQCFAEFKKAIPELMIDESRRQKLVIEKLQKEKSELEQYKTKVDELWMDKMRMEHAQIHS